jgi:leucyl aminopeptidase (aminopeptidase T)
MVDRPAALARTVLGRDLNVKAGESVVIESWSHSLPYARAFVQETRRLGGQPTVLYEDETAWWNAVGAKQTRPFGHLSKAEKAAVAAADVYVYFWGPADMRRAVDLGPVAQKFVAFNDEWYAAARKGGLRGCRMTLGLASDATAARLGLNGPRWREQLADAGTVDAAAMGRRGERLARRIQRGRELRIRHTNGTDLRIPLRGGPTRVDTGVPDAESRKRPTGMLGNNPSGQIFAILDGTKATGSLVSNRPVYNFGTYEKFDRARWTFEDGRLTSRAMAVGGKVFEKAFAAAPKGRDLLSYISIGLNPKAREVPPCEDTEEGAILVGVGGNAAFGGRSKIPFTGYAMVGGGLLEVDGVPIARGGRVL